MLASRWCSYLIVLSYVWGAWPPRAAADVGTVQDRIDWPAFLGRHDLTWDRLPAAWHEGAFLGNGLLGSMIYAPGEEAVRFDVGRSDVGWRGNRIAIGSFELRPGGKIRSSDMRLDLWNAEARGALQCEKGRLAWRAFTHAQELVNILEVEAQDGAAPPELAFLQTPAVDARKSYQKQAIDPKDRNPEPQVGSDNLLHWCVQPLLGGGGYVVAWGQRDLAGGRRLFAWTVDYVAEAAPTPAQARQAVASALQRGSEALAASHRAWWHAWWPKSFLSIPDTRMESFYWIQLYKLGSASRADRPAIDLMGPWFRATPWPRIWWNLNIQLTYWPVYAANRLDIGQSLTRMLDEGTPNLILNVPPEMRSDSAGTARTSWYDCRSGSGKELGSLTWVMHNYWLQYRYSGDETMLRQRLFPLLRRSATFMIRKLQAGPDGVLHFPVDVSPEYPKEAPDTNYNIALLRWALQTLIATDARLKLNDPDAPRWAQTLEKLAPYPVDEKTGYMIGRGVPLAQSHRHFSHLLMVYPLHLVDPMSPADRPLIEKSLDHWIHFEGALQGYSFTGASAMCSWLRRRGPNVDLLNQFIERFVKPNTMYLEAGPVIETPLAGAASINEIVLQSWSMQPFGTHIRVFPALPDAWRDATIHNMLAEGAFQVSAVRRDGRTCWVQITSLAGNPCRVETGLEGAIAAAGGRTFTVASERDGDGQMVTSVDLRKGESVLLYPASRPPTAAELELAPVAVQKGRENWFGSRKVPPVAPRADGGYWLDTPAAALHGEGFVVNRRRDAKPDIGGWIKPESWIAWKLHVARPGRFGVRISYASPRDGVKVRIALESPASPGQPLSQCEVSLPRSGSYTEFKDADAGQIDATQAGDVLLTARSADGKAPFINIEHIELLPR